MSLRDREEIQDRGVGGTNNPAKLGHLKHLMAASIELSLEKRRAG